jgi:hypothetical protein
MEDEKIGYIKLTLELALPCSEMTSKEAIAQYLNDKLAEDPEFFGWFGEENIEITHPVLD